MDEIDVSVFVCVRDVRLFKSSLFVFSILQKTRVRIRYMIYRIIKKYPEIKSTKAKNTSELKNVKNTDVFTGEMNNFI